MLHTPVALELALRCPLVISLGGEDDKPETAESTLVRGAEVSAMVADDARCLRKSYLKLRVSIDDGM